MLVSADRLIQAPNVQLTAHKVVKVVTQDSRIRNFRLEIYVSNMGVFVGMDRLIQVPNVLLTAHRVVKFVTQGTRASTRFLAY